VLPDPPTVQLPLRYDDPSGRFHIRSIDRDCEGRLLRFAGPDGGSIRARLVSEVPLANCKLRVPVPDAGAFRVLGWAPQGVVVAHPTGAHLVPLDAEARPETPRVLPPDVPLPAPLPGGRASTNGSCHVRATAIGVLLHDHRPGAGATLIRPGNWENLAGVARDAVVDETCSRMAVLTTTSAYLLSRSQGPAAPPPSPP